MGNSKPKNEQEKLFDELVEVKLLYKSREKTFKQISEGNPDFDKITDELSALKRRIKTIENRISQFGESFLDVYDAELVQPLSETDILSLRDEIKDVRDSLEAIGKS